MDKKTISQLAALSGLYIPADQAGEFADYVARLFCALNPGRGACLEKASDNAGQSERIFGRVKSIEELDLTRVEPAIQFFPDR